MRAERGGRNQVVKGELRIDRPQKGPGGCTWGVAAWDHCRDDIVVWRDSRRPSWRFRDSWNKRGLKRQKSTVERQRIDCTRGGRLRESILSGSCVRCIFSHVPCIVPLFPHIR